MEINWLRSDDTYSYITKGHVDFDDFMAALKLEVSEDDKVLTKKPVHAWGRWTRDFEEQCTVFDIGARPGSRGAFRVTMVSCGWRE